MTTATATKSASSVSAEMFEDAVRGDNAHIANNLSAKGLKTEEIGHGWMGVKLNPATKIEDYWDLSEKNLSTLHIVNLHAYNTKLRGTIIQNSYMPSAIFDHAWLEGADLSHSDFTDSKFLATNLRGAKLHNTILKEAKLQHAHLEGAEFIAARLQNADFRSANASNAVFTGAELAGAQMQLGDFTGADFTGASLSGANFKGAVLIDAKGISPIEGAINTFEELLKETSRIAREVKGKNSHQADIDVRNARRYIDIGFGILDGREKTNENAQLAGALNRSAFSLHESHPLPEPVLTTKQVLSR